MAENAELFLRPLVEEADDEHEYCNDPYDPPESLDSAADALFVPVAYPDLSLRPYASYSAAVGRALALELDHDPIVSVHSDPDSDAQIVAVTPSARDPLEFEWEEIDAGVHDDEYHVAAAEEDEDDEVDVNVVDWEVFLAISNRGFDLYEETDEAIYAFDHYIQHESALKGCPPAARSAVERLPTIFLADGDTACAVCKDAFAIEEGATRLPCNHVYHADCILPWLAIRNTCPVCRYELPIEDASAGDVTEEAVMVEEVVESQTRYDFEILARV